MVPKLSSDEFPGNSQMIYSIFVLFLILKIMARNTRFKVSVFYQLLSMYLYLTKALVTAKLFFLTKLFELHVTVYGNSKGE